MCCPSGTESSRSEKPALLTATAHGSGAAGVAAVSLPRGGLSLAHSTARGTHRWSPCDSSSTETDGGTCLISPPITFLPHYSLGATDVQVNKQAGTKGMVGVGRPRRARLRQPCILSYFLQADITPACSRLWSPRTPEAQIQLLTRPGHLGPSRAPVDTALTVGDPGSDLLPHTSGSAFSPCWGSVAWHY